VADLSQCVNAGICSTCHSHSKVVSILAKDLGEGLEHFTLDSPEGWLFGPTGKVGAVVGEVDPETRKPAG
jgi:hypothetical protein